MNMGVGSWGTWAVLHRTGSWEPQTGSHRLGALGNPKLEHDPSVSSFTTHCLALATGELTCDCGSRVRLMNGMEKTCI